MGTAGRSAPLRRTGSLLGLLGLELAAVLALHWLGRFEGLRIAWDAPVSRCASTAITLLATKYPGTPMSTMRVMALGASFVCSVLKTKCPVKEACTAISAVS